MKTNHWEFLTEDTSRMAVPGGWILKTVIQGGGWISGSGNQTNFAISTVFVPDRFHDWIIIQETTRFDHDITKTEQFEKAS